MANTEISLSLKEIDSIGNNFFSINITNDNRKICSYMTLINHYKICIDIIVDNFMAIKPESNMKETLYNYYHHLKKRIQEDEELFLKSSVMDGAIELCYTLDDIVTYPERYMKSLIDKRNTLRFDWFSNTPMSDAVAEECKQHPQEMAIAIMGEKVADALLFIPNILQWSGMYPILKITGKEMRNIAQKAMDIVQHQLNSIPHLAKNPIHPLFFCRWHLDDAAFQLENNLKYANK